MAARRLGELLVAKGKLSEAQLKKALQAQMIWGGHLGTNLIELGYVTEDELGEALAEAHAVRYAGYAMLQEIPSSVLTSIPRGLIEKHKLVPFLFDGKKLHLVMLQPKDLAALDEISFATGFQLIPYVTPEIRLFQILEKYYSIPRAKRYITLTKELPARGPGRPAAGKPAGGPDSFPTGPRPASSILEGREPQKAAESPGPEQAGPEAESPPPAPDPEPSSPEVYGSTAASEWNPREGEGPGGSGASGSPAAPKELVPKPLPEERQGSRREQGLDRLLHAGTLEEVCGSLIEESAATFRRCAVFARSGDSMVSIAGLATGSSSWTIEGLALPYDMPAVEALFADGRTYYVGPPPSGTDEATFYEKLGGPPPPNAFLAPIRLNERIAMIFYGDQADEEVRPREVDTVLSMVQQAGLAMDLLTLRRKDSPE